MEQEPIGEPSADGLLRDWASQGQGEQWGEPAPKAGGGFYPNGKKFAISVINRNVCSGVISS